MTHFSHTPLINLIPSEVFLFHKVRYFYIDITYKMLFDCMYCIQREGRAGRRGCFPPLGRLASVAVRLQVCALTGPHRKKGNGKKGGEVLFGNGGKGGEHEGGAFLPLGRSTSLAVKLQDHALTGPNTNEGNGKGGREWKGGK